eukprot:m.289883 g.289883  ORF g.289883 m.289883 type:complete len:231 (-) comp12207_c0_seq1:82-774(-)
MPSSNVTLLGGHCCEESHEVLVGRCSSYFFSVFLSLWRYICFLVTGAWKSARSFPCGIPCCICAFSCSLLMRILFFAISLPFALISDLCCLATCGCLCRRAIKAPNKHPVRDAIASFLHIRNEPEMPPPGGWQAPPGVGPHFRSYAWYYRSNEWENCAQCCCPCCYKTEQMFSPNDPNKPPMTQQPGPQSYQQHQQQPQSNQHGSPPPPYPGPAQPQYPQYPSSGQTFTI